MASAHALTVIVEPDGRVRSVVRVDDAAPELVESGLTLPALARRICGAAADPDRWAESLAAARSPGAAAQHFDVLVDPTGNATRRLRREVVATPVRSPTGDLDCVVLQFSLARLPDDPPDPTEERFKFLAESLPMLLWIALPDGSFEYVSPAWERFTGLSVRQILANGYYDLVHPDDLAEIVATELAFDRDDRFTYPACRFRHAVDGYRYVETHVCAVRDERGNVSRIVGAVIDVTKRHEAEESVRRSNEQLSTALEVSGLAQYDLDLETGRCRFDAQIYDWFRIDPPAGGADTPIELEQMLALIHPDDVDRVRSKIARVRTGEDVWLRDTHRVVIAGDHGPEVRTVFAVARREGGGQRAARMFGVVEDITTKSAETAARLRSQKREALGTLAGGIAHDFNNIIAAIAMSAEVVQDELDHGMRPDESLAEIRRAADRAAELVQRLVTFSRDEEPDPLPFDVAEVVRETCTLMRPTLRRGVELSAREPAGPIPRVLGSASQTHQVLVNLLANARDAVAEEGRQIEVAIDAVDLTADTIEALGQQPHQSPPGRYVRISVADDGTGIRPEYLSRIYDPFFTTKRPGEGTGLGLAGTQSIVRAHGGIITAENRLDGRGARFTVLLPAASDER